MMKKSRSYLLLGITISLCMHVSIILNFTANSERTKYSKHNTDKQLIKAVLISARKQKHSSSKNTQGVTKKKNLKQKADQIAEISDAKVNQGQKTLLALYLDQLRKLVLSYQFYPFVARKLKQEGEVRLGIIVKNDGEILSVKLNKTSRFKTLDDAAIEVIKRINKFPQFPRKLNMKDLVVEIPIIYKLVAD